MATQFGRAHRTSLFGRFHAASAESRSMASAGRTSAQWAKRSIRGFVSTTEGASAVGREGCGRTATAQPLGSSNLRPVRFRAKQVLSLKLPRVLTVGRLQRSAVGRARPGRQRTIVVCDYSRRGRPPEQAQSFEPQAHKTPFQQARRLRRHLRRRASNRSADLHPT
jgi:hypothetical protein